MVYPMNQLKQDAATLSNLCKKDTIGAVVILGHYILDCGSMGYPLVADFPSQSHLYPNDTTPEVFKIERPIPIIRPQFERRTWFLKELKEQHYIPRKVAVMDVWKDSTWGTHWPFKRSMADVRGRVFIFETGDLSLSDVIEKMIPSK